MQVETTGLKKDNLGLNKQLQQVVEEKKNVETGMIQAKQSLARKGEELVQLQKEVTALRRKEKTMAANLEKEIDAKKDAIRRLEDAQLQLNVYVGYTADFVDLNENKLYASPPLKSHRMTYLGVFY